LSLVSKLHVFSAVCEVSLVMGRDAYLFYIFVASLYYPFFPVGSVWFEVKSGTQNCEKGSCWGAFLTGLLTIHVFSTVYTVGSRFGRLTSC
jgi:hypothetical protein